MINLKLDLGLVVGTTPLVPLYEHSSQSQCRVTVGLIKFVVVVVVTAAAGTVTSVVARPTACGATNTSNFESELGP